FVCLVCCVLSAVTAPPLIYTLSLHDALPIFHLALDGAEVSIRTQPTTSETASANMMTAITPSSTRHARGVRRYRPSQRAPTPRAVNHTSDATEAPSAKSHRSSPCVAATEPSRKTVSRYTCGLSQVSARAVSATGNARFRLAGAAGSLSARVGTSAVVESEAPPSA